MQTNQEFTINSRKHTTLVFKISLSQVAFDSFKEKTHYLLEHLDKHEDIQFIILNLMKAGGIQIFFTDKIYGQGLWQADKRIIKLKWDLSHVRTLDTLVFELCNANNKDLNQLYYEDYQSSAEYAEKVEIVESRSSEQRHKLVVKGVKEFNWSAELPSYKNYKPFSLSGSQIRSIAYGGYSHFHLNMKFHNDYMLNRAINLFHKLIEHPDCNTEMQKETIISEIYERKKLKLHLHYDAQKHFPTQVLRACREKNTIPIRYSQELSNIEFWFKEESQKIETEYAKFKITTDNPSLKFTNNH